MPCNLENDRIKQNRILTPFCVLVNTIFKRFEKYNHPLNWHFSNEKAVPTISLRKWSTKIMIRHDDVIKWKHFPRHWPFVRGIHRSGEFPTQRPVTRSFDVFFDLRLNKRLSKQPWGWWFETPSFPLWRQCNGQWLITLTDGIDCVGVAFLSIQII